MLSHQVQEKLEHLNRSIKYIRSRFKNDTNISILKYGLELVNQNYDVIAERVKSIYEC